MNYQIPDDASIPNILIVQETPIKIEPKYFKYPLLTKVNYSKYLPGATLSWIQQNQPDLVILELKQKEAKCLNLIPSLKLDWLTRDIPILVTGSKFTLQSIVNLDYDGFLKTPYSLKELERKVSFLLSLSLHPVFA